MKKHIRVIVTLCLSAVIIISYAYSKGFFSREEVVSLSVSSDGEYVISAHYGGELVLWNIPKREKKTLAKNANTYSAYFIPESHEFIWQDTGNIIHIQNVVGQEIKQFPHFKTEGHRITADKSFYLSANTSGKLYKGYGENLVPIYTDTPISPIKPYDLSIAGDYFLSVSDNVTNRNAPPAETNLMVNPVNPDHHKKGSYDGVTLWDRQTLKPVARLWGNNHKTTGLLSPDGKWVVTGSENYGRYMWSTANPLLRYSLAYPEDGIYNRETKMDDKSQLLPIPEKFKDKQLNGRKPIVAYAFVTETEFIQLGITRGEKDSNADELAPLYTVGDPWIKAYVEIGNEPAISVDSYAASLSISSAPKARILVTGQATGGGINVYKYHPDKMELEKIWVAD
ncbi:WD40 repeat domain-containing protein [Actinobacillus equuli subsp. haemolyticus]|uniref:WD40 repeat domain-containing protein n=1 Tax=Actinobacillus equuli TaxID=718 RepID=UPI0024467B9E|nr:WD40 repeat domain-containing protein [Actinobacillus equuli]WGE73868.1 WD40 repeat domain-containing protein [Actinobacillus equuli subsp. haemolyticus]